MRGDFIEAGCALGGSSALISSIIDADRLFYIYDVFGQIPPPTANDPIECHNRYDIIASGLAKGIGDDDYYGYQVDLMESAKANISCFSNPEHSDNIRFCKGDLRTTMNISAPIAFAHIDVDWYEGVRACIERIVPFLAIGGSIIFDDFADWGGCKIAVEELLSEAPSDFCLDNIDGSLCLTKMG